MTDLMVWGGPVYCSTLNSVVWKRPTKIFCKPLEGQSNAGYWAQLAATGNPLAALVADSKLGQMPQSLGISGFSAAHEWMSDFLGAVGEAVCYAHLSDSCFMGAGATAGKQGYVRYARLAAAGKVRMTVTSNGPWNADIHYKGPAGSKYEGTNFDLTSGSKCVLNVAREAFGSEPAAISFDLPPGLPYQPERMFRKGEFYWAHYNERTMADPHGDHIKLAAPFIQMYGVPWMAGERGFGMKHLFVTGIFATLGYLGAKLGWEWYYGNPSVRRNPGPPDPKLHAAVRDVREKIVGMVRADGATSLYNRFKGRHLQAFNELRGSLRALVAEASKSDSPADRQFARAVSEYLGTLGVGRPIDPSGYRSALVAWERSRG